MSGLVAIHQPNFFPWLGYFDKIRRADIFVFLDAVDYPRTGAGTWVNRVKIAIQGEARWATCHVKSKARGNPILDAEINDDQFWRVKLLKTLDANYRKAPCYDETMKKLEPLFKSPQTNLASFNIAAIKVIAAKLGISTPLVRQSELPHKGQATELLISLVKAAGGDAYLAGGGAGGYQQDELFAANGVRLEYQGFEPEVYGPAERFISGLSVIDYLMYDGRPLDEVFENTKI